MICFAWSLLLASVTFSIYVDNMALSLYNNNNMASSSHSIPPLLPPPSPITTWIVSSVRQASDKVISGIVFIMGGIVGVCFQVMHAPSKGIDREAHKKWFDSVVLAFFTSLLVFILSLFITKRKVIGPLILLLAVLFPIHFLADSFLYAARIVKPHYFKHYRLSYIQDSVWLVLVVAFALIIFSTGYLGAKGALFSDPTETQRP